MSQLGNREVFAQNLQRYMDERGISRQELSKALHIPYTTICDWLNANKYPRINKIEMLALYFGVRKADLVEYEQEGKEKPYQIIPVYTPFIRAVPQGMPEPVKQEIMEQAKGRFFGVMSDDDTMAPECRRGDVVLFRCCYSAPDECFGAVLIGEEPVVFRSVKKIAGGILVTSLNPSAVSPHFYSSEEVHRLPVKVVGIAVELRRKWPLPDAEN